MSDLPQNKACPMCQKNGHDSDGSHLFLMADGNKYCCNRVEYHDNNDFYLEEVDGPDTIDALLGEVREEHEEPEVKVFDADYNIEDLPAPGGYRNIPEEQYTKFGVHALMKGDEVSKVFYPMYTHSDKLVHKVRICEPKDFYTTESVKGAKLKFQGQQLYAGQKECLITEGQDDMIAADWMINQKRGPKFQVLVLSVPNGANLKAFQDNFEFLREFGRVTFDPDTDDAGSELTEQVVALMPDVRVLKKHKKDACDMNMAGMQDEYVEAYKRAEHYQPPSVIMVDEDLADSIREPLDMGLTYPWSSLTEMTYGMVPHQIISVGSGPGVGKSTVIRAIQQHLMFEHKEPIGIMALEDEKKKMIRYLVGYMMNKKIHVPEAIYDGDEAFRLAMSLRDKAYIFDNRYFKGDWKNIEVAIRYMHAEGVTKFFIDPVSALAAHLGSSDANTFINSIMIKMSRMIQELPITLMLVNHLNNPKTGPAHDEGGRVLPSQFTGSKGQWRYSTDMWGFERNSLHDDPAERHIMTVRNLKHRDDGNMMGRTCKLKYNPKTGRLEEMGGVCTVVTPPSSGSGGSFGSLLTGGD